MTKTLLRSCITAGILASLFACSADTPQDHFANAKQFSSEANYGAAIIELKSALQIDRKSAEARWLLGQAYLHTADVLSAEKELQRALDLGWSRNDVMPALAEAQLEQRKYKEVLAIKSHELLPVAAGELFAFKAVAAISLGRVEEAQRWIGEAQLRAPNSTDIQIAKAKILGMQAKYSEAAEVLNNLLARDEKNAKVWALLGDLRMGQQLFAGAMEAFSNAIDNAPGDYGALFKRSVLALQLGQFKQSQADARVLLRQFPKHMGAHYVRGIGHFREGKFQNAIKSLSLAEPSADEFPMVLFFLASALLVEGQPELASEFAARFYAMAPGNVRGRLLYATAQLQLGNYAGVQDLLGPVLEVEPDNVGALNLMSNALLRDGKADEGLTLLSRIAVLRPDSPIAQLRLGASLFMRGQNADAAQYLEAALELDPEFQQAEILLIMNHLQKKEFEAAIEAAEAYRKRDETSTTPLTLLGRVYAAAGQTDKAKLTFEKALELNPVDPASNHQLALIAVAKGDVASARRYYETVLEQNEPPLSGFLQLAHLDAKEENKSALEEHLNAAIEAYPEAVEPRIFLGRYHLSQGRPEKVAPLFSDMEEMQKQAPRVLQLMARAQLSNKEHAAAQFTLSQLLEDTPESAELYQMMAKAAAGTGDRKTTEQYLRKALSLDADYVPALLGLAKLALRNDRMQEFDSQVERLKVLAPNSADVFLLRATAKQKEGDTKAVLKLTEQAYAAAATRKTVLAFAAAKIAAGDSSGAIALYESRIAKYPKDIALRLRVADILRNVNRVDEAMSEYAAILQLEPNNSTALNVLAWHLRHANTPKALEYARRAVNAAPRSAQVLHTLALVEYIDKDYQRAARTIERALQEGADDPTLHYHSAMIAVANGKNRSAIKTLNELLRRNKQFAQADQAKALLRDLTK